MSWKSLFIIHHQKQKNKERFKWTKQTNDLLTRHYLCLHYLTACDLNESGQRKWFWCKFFTRQPVFTDQSRQSRQRWRIRRAPLVLESKPCWIESHLIPSVNRENYGKKKIHFVKQIHFFYLTHIFITFKLQFVRRKSNIWKTNFFF